MLQPRMKNTRQRQATGWKSAAEVLKSLVPDLPITGRVEDYRVWEVWEEAVGRAVAERAWPSKAQHGKLFVTVAHPAVIQELQFLKGRLVRSLNQALAKHGAPPVKPLFFVLGRPQDMARPPKEPAGLPPPQFSELRVPDLGKPELEAAFAAVLAKRRQRLAKKR